MKPRFLLPFAPSRRRRLSRLEVNVAERSEGEMPQQGGVRVLLVRPAIKSHRPTSPNRAVVLRTPSGMGGSGKQHYDITNQFY